jgi:hypothetical protein
VVVATARLVCLGTDFFRNEVKPSSGASILSLGLGLRDRFHSTAVSLT